MNDKDLTKKSKRLSKILRHAPESVGIVLEPAGWAKVDDILRATSLTTEELAVVVRENNKKRFEFNEDLSKIRAVQGHSVDVDLGYEEAELVPAVLFHGTAEVFLPAILKEGLKKMGRNHVHLSADEETARKVGARHGKPIVLAMNAFAMKLGGARFYQARNGVWLTDFVGSNFIVDTRSSEWEIRFRVQEKVTE